MRTRVGLMSLVLGLLLSWVVPVAGVAVMLIAAIGMAIASEGELVGAADLRLEPVPSLPVASLPVDVVHVDNAA